MGQSVLRIHKVDAVRYAPYGYFGLFDGHLALPVEEPVFLEAFSKHFALERVDKPGLSVVIPYPDREISLRGCANSVIRHYFFPILAGRLIVELKFDGKKVRLDALNLGEYLQEIPVGREAEASRVDGAGTLGHSTDDREPYPAQGADGQASGPSSPRRFSIRDSL